MKGLRDFPREDEASVSTERGRKEGKVFRDVETTRRGNMLPQSTTTVPDLKHRIDSSS